MTYESPTLTEVGSLHELTLGKIGLGSSDNIHWFVDFFLS
jgi:hypothetical protein